MSTPVPPRPGQPLTAREIDLLSALATGLTHAQAGKRMNLATASISGCVNRIRIKLGARNALHAVMLACDAGLIGSGAEWAQQASAARAALAEAQRAIALAIDEAGTPR